VGIDLKNPETDRGTEGTPHAAQKARLGTGRSVPKAVFLDRDGVLNRFTMRDGTPRPPAGLDELAVYPDATEALRRLKQAAYLLIVVTNQPDIARGTQTRQAVEQIHAALGEALPIDEFVVCAHDDADNCLCRKPKPGMVLEAAARNAVDLGESFLIGDRWRDIDCGAAAGVRTVFIERGYGERAPEHAPDFVAESLGDAAEWIVGWERQMAADERR
jgi:D-glycero-D-manno-heptose 1,7-bisphosphate phosphatase